MFVEVNRGFTEQIKLNKNDLFTLPLFDDKFLSYKMVKLKNRKMLTPWVLLDGAE